MRFVIEFQRAVLNSTLPSPARHLLLTLAVIADWESGVIPAAYTPSLTMVAAMTGLSKSTVAEWLTVLDTTGWLKRERPLASDGRTRTRYTLLIGAAAAAKPHRASRRGSTEYAAAPGNAAGSPEATSVPNDSAEPVRVADTPTGPPSGTSPVRPADSSSPPGGPITFLNSPTESSTSKDRSRSRERRITETGPAPAHNESGTRLTPDFRVTDDMARWARQHTPNVPPTATAAFIDYWIAQPGLKGRRCDWAATWRNWMRREQIVVERHPGFRGTPVQTVVAPAVPEAAEMCRDHRGHRAATCGLCRADRIAGDGE